VIGPVGALLATYVLSELLWWGSGSAFATNGETSTLRYQFAGPLEEGLSCAIFDGSPNGDSTIANYLAGRFGYVATSLMLYVAAVTAAFYAYYVLRGVTVRPRGVAAVIVAFAVIGVAVAFSPPTAYALGVKLLVANILSCADTTSLMGSLAIRPLFGDGDSASAVVVLLAASTAVTLFSVGALLLVLVTVTRDPGSSAKAFENRLNRILWTLWLGSAILALSVVTSSALLDWPLSVLTSDQREALQPLASGMTTLLGVSGSIALLAAISPAYVAHRIDLGGSKIPEETRKQLGGALVEKLTSVLAILAPLLAAPAFGVVQSIVEFLGDV
jgi:hypothetical protein